MEEVVWWVAMSICIAIGMTSIALMTGLPEAIQKRRQKTLPRRKTLPKAKTAAYRAADDVEGFSMFEVVTMAEEAVGWTCKYGHKNGSQRTFCYGPADSSCSEQRPKKIEGDLFKLPEVAPARETVSVGRRQEPEQEIPEGDVEWLDRGAREAIYSVLSVPSPSGAPGWPLPHGAFGHLLTCKCSLCQWR